MHDKGHEGALFLVEFYCGDEAIRFRVQLPVDYSFLGRWGDASPNRLHICYVAVFHGFDRVLFGEFGQVENLLAHFCSDLVFGVIHDLRR